MTLESQQLIDRVLGESYYQDPETSRYHILSAEVQILLTLFNNKRREQGRFVMPDNVFGVVLKPEHPLYVHPTACDFRKVWLDRCERVGNAAMAENIRRIEAEFPVPTV